MVTASYLKYFFPVKVMWFNPDIHIRLDGKGIFRFKQSIRIEEIEGYHRIRKKSVNTILIDLEANEDRIFRDFRPTHRHDIKIIQKLIKSGKEIRVERNRHINRFIYMANAFIGHKQNFRGKISIHDLNRYFQINNGELLTIRCREKVLGGVFYILDPPFRVRCLFVFNDRCNDMENAVLYPCYTKYLHYHAMVHIYKKEGYKYYDLGGLYLNLKPEAPTYGIANFKQGFGGKIVEEYDYEFASGKILRKLYPIFAYKKEHRLMLKNEKTALHAPK